MTFEEWAISVGLGDIEPHSRGDFWDCWQAATTAERERCAKIAETMESEWWRQYKDPKNRFAADMHTQGKSDGAGAVAAAIRVKEEPK